MINIRFVVVACPGNIRLVVYLIFIRYFKLTLAICSWQAIVIVGCPSSIMCHATSIASKDISTSSWTLMFVQIMPLSAPGVRPRPHTFQASAGFQDFTS